MRSPRTWLLALVGVFAVANLWITFQRSGIPMALDGVVERVEVRREKHPGVDDVHLVTVAGATHHLDGETAVHLVVGERVSKRSFEAALETPSGKQALGISRDARRMALAMPAIVLVAWVLLRPRRDRPRRSRPRPSGARKPGIP